MQLEIGNIVMKQTKKVSQQWVGEKEIREITPSCYCTDFSFNNSTKTITCEYDAVNFNPARLYSEGSQKIYQYGTIYYKDGSVERINLVGNIVLR